MPPVSLELSQAKTLITRVGTRIKTMSKVRAETQIDSLEEQVELEASTRLHTMGFQNIQNTDMMIQSQKLQLQILPQEQAILMPSLALEVAASCLTSRFAYHFSNRQKLNKQLQVEMSFIWLKQKKLRKKKPNKQTKHKMKLLMTRKKT